MAKTDHLKKNLIVCMCFRFVYLYVYGGLYADMDYLPVENHQPLIDFMKENEVNILLSNEQHHSVGKH